MITGYLGAAVDVTARRAAAEALRGALTEKELLLRELQHRVKNSLHVVASLLNLHASRTESAEARSLLSDLHGRVLAMALLHEELNLEGSSGEIDVKRYLEGVVAAASRANGRSDVRVELALERVIVRPAVAIPLGLLVDELVANAYKHAFPGGLGGRIRVAVAPEGTDRELVVTDDGVGGAEGPPSAKPTSLGLVIAKSLAMQLGGALETSRSERETRVRVRFAGEGRA